VKIVIVGGTGGIGRKLIKKFQDKHSIIILSRSKDRVISQKVKVVNYSNNTEDWYDELNKSDVIINLAGESINHRWWSKKQKEIILNSRLDSVTKISEALKSINHRPKLIMNASAVGYYAYSNKRQDESSNNGSHFLSDVCFQLENKAHEKFSSKTDRLVILRIGVVLDSDSGILSKLSPIFKYGMGAIIGSGSQGFPWIDIDDVVGSISYIMNSDIKGPINLTSPSEDTNYIFSKNIGKVFKRPVFIRVPHFCIRMILGEMSQIATNSLNIYPRALLNKGYKFKFYNIYKSLKKNYIKD